MTIEEEVAMIFEEAQKKANIYQGKKFWNNSFENDYDAYKLSINED
jgi:hypothetical protein